VNVEVIEGRIGGGTGVYVKEGKITLTMRLHFYDGGFSHSTVRVEQHDDKIVIIAERVEHIKKLLVRRESLGAVVWSILQNEYRTLDRMEEKVEKLQNASIHSYQRSILYDIVEIKKNLFFMHRDYIRLRNIVEGAIDERYDVAEMRRILRDLNEMIDIVEYLIAGTTTAIQLMQNTLSSKMNEVMKILTVIATIMMPLTLIAGIYGMNFRNMPELYWYYGYYYSLTLMALIAVAMLWYFHKRKII